MEENNFKDCQTVGKWQYIEEGGLLVYSYGGKWKQ